MALEEAALRLGLDPFGDDGEAEGLGERDDRVRDRRVVGAAGRLRTNERSILIWSSGRRVR